ncbi:MAG: hypothetical protein IJ763_10200 [Lachnospiraceae bacterium]|nr:hypothetical protein [Lachnospiraceae bacterium]
MEKGYIDTSQLSTPPENHELETAKFFADLGKNIIFINPINIKGTHTPDIIMDGVEWEIKSPTGSSKHTIENNFRNAISQSKYIIFDLRRIKLPEAHCLSRLEFEFKLRKYLKRLLIIKKDNSLIEIKK